MSTIIKRRFVLPRTTEIEKIVDKYSKCKECYALTPAEEAAFALFEILPEYERTLLILFAELRSCRKVAKLVGTSHETANRAYTDLKKAIKKLIK